METASELVFNALTGPELKAHILDTIGKKLDATGEFVAHITFPWVKYTFEVGIVAYPKQAVDAPPEIVAKGEEELGDETIGGSRKDTKISGEEVVDTPDAARIASGLPIPTIAPGPGGVKIDKPVMPKVEEKKGGMGYGKRAPSDASDANSRSTGPDSRP